MEKWTHKYNSCISCQGTRFPHRGRGYCSRCYALILKIKQVESWNEADRSTWVGFPKNINMFAVHFDRIKKSFSQQYSDRLNYFKYIETKLKGPISGLDLEYKLIEVANLCGTNGGVLFGHDAGAFESYLAPDQRLFIYLQLHSIVEAKKWKGIDWYEVYK